MTSDTVRAKAGTLLEGAYEQIVSALGMLGYPVTSDDNYADTAGRAARAMLELVHPVDEIETEVRDMLARTFPATYDGMVISKHNTCFGMCPHHLLPVIYRVSVAYLPSKRVLGISKLSRLVHLLARRPVLQEDLTNELAAMLHDRLESRGSAVFIEGLHMCMAARGIEAHEANVMTSAVRGAFLDQPETRQEFLHLVSAPRSGLL
ncbi:MAG: GTP cyclohydrolase I [Kofleriaceae bacterium]